MKILFYDIKELEFDLISSNMPNNIEPYFFKHPILNSTYIDEKHKDAQGLCVFVSSRLDKEVLLRFKNLKYIFLRSSGYSNVDLSYCKKHEIKIFNTPSYAPNSIAEFAFGLILSLSRKISAAQAQIKEGNIDQGNLMGFELNNKTIGIIGAGNIGKQIIKIAQGFNMKTLVYDVKKEENLTYCGLEELYQESDIIVLSCPLTINTKNLINQNAFNKMKKNAILINVARGEIVDIKALSEALVKKKISGCALDVIECEQEMCNLWDFCINTDKREYCLKKFLFIQQLKTMQNVIITPHIAYNTKEALVEIIKITLQNIQSSFEINSDTKNLVML